MSGSLEVLWDHRPETLIALVLPELVTYFGPVLPCCWPAQAFRKSRKQVRLLDSNLERQYWIAARCVVLLLTNMVMVLVDRVSCSTLLESLDWKRFLFVVTVSRTSAYWPVVGSLLHGYWRHVLLEEPLLLEVVLLFAKEILGPN